jgi:hypothetical protein
MVIRFDTTQERHVKAIAALLRKLYDGKPVGSLQLEAAYEMEHAQVLKYLHLAHAAGLATPVYRVVGGKTYGWLPGHVPNLPSLMDQRIARVAKAVEKLFKGQPLSTVEVAQHLKANDKSVQRWLREAWRRGRIVRSSSPAGWKPRA